MSTPYLFNLEKFFGGNRLCDVVLSGHSSRPKVFWTVKIWEREHVWTVKIWERERRESVFGWGEGECLAEGGGRVFVSELSTTRMLVGYRHVVPNLHPETSHFISVNGPFLLGSAKLTKVGPSSAFKAVTNRFCSMTQLRKWWLCPAHTLLILRTLSLSELVEALIHCGRYLRSPFPWPIITVTIPLYRRYTVSFSNQLVVFYCFGEVDSWYS